MDLLEISGDEAGKTIFRQPSRDSRGWIENYIVEISMPGVSANVLVDNNPAGRQPTEFFAELALSWRGWKG